MDPGFPREQYPDDNAGLSMLDARPRQPQGRLEPPATKIQVVKEDTQKPPAPPASPPASNIWRDMLKKPEAGGEEAGPDGAEAGEAPEPGPEAAQAAPDPGGEAKGEAGASSGQPTAKQPEAAGDAGEAAGKEAAQAAEKVPEPAAANPANEPAGAGAQPEQGAAPPAAQAGEKGAQEGADPGAEKGGEASEEQPQHGQDKAGADAEENESVADTAEMIANGCAFTICEQMFVHDDKNLAEILLDIAESLRTIAAASKTFSPR